MQEWHAQRNVPGPDTHCRSHEEGKKINQPKQKASEKDLYSNKYIYLSIYLSI